MFVLALNLVARAPAVVKPNSALLFFFFFVRGCSWIVVVCRLLFIVVNLHCQMPISIRPLQITSLNHWPDVFRSIPVRLYRHVVVAAPCWHPEHSPRRFASVCPVHITFSLPGCVEYLDLGFACPPGRSPDPECHSQPAKSPDSPEISRQRGVVGYIPGKPEARKQRILYYGLGLSLCRTQPSHVVVVIESERGCRS